MEIEEWDEHWLTIVLKLIQKYNKPMIIQDFIRYPNVAELHL